MTHQILCIADDFGWSTEVNRAILHAHAQGALDGASLMMGQPGTAEAIAMARDTPSLQVGIHFHFNDSKPCTRASWPWGASPARAGWAIGLSPAARRLMRREAQAQWRRFRATSLPCAFANGHHHLHWHPGIARALRCTLRETFTGWMRYGACRFFDPPTRPDRRLAAAAQHALVRRGRARCPFATSDTLWGLDRLFAMDAQEIRAVAPAFPPGRHELLFHPRRPREDKDLQCLLALRREVSASLS
jgi:predicted glycoside hydrolase/deacetylase ChbG (UPF0249 family)